MITCDPKICWGWPCIAGHRLRVDDVAGSIGAGETVEQYALDKEITVEQVKEALAVYECLKPLFDAYAELHADPGFDDEAEGDGEPDHDE